jgi:hypothetical protein
MFGEQFKASLTFYALQGFLWGFLYGKNPPPTEVEARAAVLAYGYPLELFETV